MTAKDHQRILTDKQAAHLAKQASKLDRSALPSQKGITVQGGKIAVTNGGKVRILHEQSRRPSR